MSSRTTLAFFLLLTLLGVSAIIAAGLGSVHYRPMTVLAALQHGPGGTDPADLIVWSLRLPRIGLAMLVGASLAAAGVAFQSLLRNDLADPYIVGVSAGASVGAEAILLRAGALWLDGWAEPLAAFVTALAAMVTVYALARRGGRVAVTSLLLAGVVISAFLGGVATLMLQLGPPQDTQHILGRLLGSLQDATPAQCAILSVFLIAGLLILLVEARAMNLFSLGEESARHLGVETERFKVVLMVTGTLLTAATVAFAGIIGFVGLMVPHISRRLAGTPDHRRVLALAVPGGALLMVWADTLARTVMPDGRELPVGIITAFLGAPFFSYLLRRHGRVS
jgi:iron complex transport system permease protein